MNRDDLIRMAREAGLLYSSEISAEWSAPIPGADYPLRLADFAALVAAAEREACAVLVERGMGDWLLGKKVANAIRARGQE